MFIKIRAIFKHKNLHWNMTMHIYSGVLEFQHVIDVSLPAQPYYWRVISFQVRILNYFEIRLKDIFEGKELKIWKIFFFKFKMVFKNHWTNTRLVCTRLTAFLNLNPIMALIIWIFIILYTFLEQASLAVVNCVEGLSYIENKDTWSIWVAFFNH